MVSRSGFILGSAALAAMSLVKPAFAQTPTVAAIKRGFVVRTGCRVYYEVTGSGPAIIFAHGLGSNHLTWWQQVPYFSDRYTCVTFSHRGYPPSSEIPGGPDPKDFVGDLAALIEYLQLPDVRLIAQSMGGVTSMEYILSQPEHKVRAVVFASTSGTIDWRLVSVPDPKRLEEWSRRATAARADLTRRGISPPAGGRISIQEINGKLSLSMSPDQRRTINTLSIKMSADLTNGGITFSTSSKLNDQNDPGAIRKFPQKLSYAKEALLAWLGEEVRKVRSQS